MKAAIGAIVLLFGAIAFGFAVTNLPSGAPPDYMVGRFLPSGVIIVLGVVILTWKKKEK